VHRSLGEQHQDGGTDITSTTPPALATAASAASAGPEGAGAKSWAEAGTEATGSESTAAAPAEAWPKWALRPWMSGVVTPNVVAELAAGLLALFVKGSAILGCESKARRPGFTCERPAHMGHACFKKWVVHWLISFLER
jgi:hypothetical protein